SCWYCFVLAMCTPYAAGCCTSDLRPPSNEVQNELKHQAADLSALQAGCDAIPMVIKRAQGAA
ncbi:hypothetical protein, partial [Ideonella sp. A 288]|uniref:hypothetical protein n=1 Tax=Ideonella sp. A 288 TaxID=1962181 RepID=UPI001F2E9394